MRGIWKKGIAAGLLGGMLVLSAAGLSMGTAVPLAAQAAAPGESAGGGAAIYVDADNGLDTNEGTLEAPVQTLKRAQELARGLAQDMDGDVTVFLRGGRYTLEETLRFGPEDSGRGGFNVVWTSYEGEEAEISGGIRITDWTLHDAEKGIWSAPARGVGSRDFFVDGERAVRARSGKLQVLDLDSAYAVMMVAPDESLPESFARPQELEVTAGAAWHWHTVHVEAVFEKKGYMGVQFTEASWATAGFSGDKDAQYLENAYELLDEPGEWYLDREGDRIYYMPMEGQDMENADAVLGRLEELIRFEGTPDAPVEHIALRDLTFSHTTWLFADNPDGLLGFGQNVVKNATSGGDNLTLSLSAVYGEYLDHMEVSGVRFLHLGNNALHYSDGTKNTQIVRNRVEDIGGGGIYLGNISKVEETPEGLKKLVENNVIEDNVVRDVGLTYKSADGIFTGPVARTRVEHNTIVNVPYNGICMGHGTINQPIFTDNSIAYNYIENTMHTLFDGGGIYIVRWFENTSIMGNYVVQCGANGIYLDDMARGITVTGNVIRDSERNFLYKGDYNYIYDNYTSNARKEDSDMRTPIGDNPVYRLENNDLWDEAAVEAIRAASGARLAEAEESVPSGEAPSGDEGAQEPADVPSGDAQSGAPGAEGSESLGEEQPTETKEPAEGASGEAKNPEADADASPQEDGAKVPVAVWVLLPVLAAGAVAWASIRKRREKEEI